MYAKQFVYVFLFNSADRCCGNVSDCCFVYTRKNEVHNSSSLEVYYQCLMQETHTNMVLELFTQIIKEPCFDILRTQEQLGIAAR